MVVSWVSFFIMKSQDQRFVLLSVNGFLVSWKRLHSNNMHTTLCTSWRQQTYGCFQLFVSVIPSSRFLSLLQNLLIHLFKNFSSLLNPVSLFHFGFLSKYFQGFNPIWTDVFFWSVMDRRGAPAISALGNLRNWC